MSSGSQGCPTPRTVILTVSVYKRLEIHEILEVSRGHLQIAVDDQPHDTDATGNTGRPRDLVYPDKRCLAEFDQDYWEEELGRRFVELATHEERAGDGLA